MAAKKNTKRKLSKKRTGPKKNKSGKRAIAKTSKKTVKKKSLKAGKIKSKNKIIKKSKPGEKTSAKAAKKIPVKKLQVKTQKVILKKSSSLPAPGVNAIKKEKASRPAVKKELQSNKTNPAPPQETIQVKKVIKTFSTKNESKDAGKKSPPHPNQYSIEYLIHASASLLFEFISSPSGLSEWFADDVNIRDGNFTFFWDGSTQVAKQIAYKQDKLVRFQWEGKPDYTFFEMLIETDELTNDTSLIVTDFAEDGDKESARLLWDNQINKLRKAMGS